VEGLFRSLRHQTAFPDPTLPAHSQFKQASFSVFLISGFNSLKQLGNLLITGVNFFYRSQITAVHKK
jgi:hypothetical protein